MLLREEEQKDKRAEKERNNREWMENEKRERREKKRNNRCEGVCECQCRRRRNSTEEEARRMGIGAYGEHEQDNMRIELRLSGMHQSRVVLFEPIERHGDAISKCNRWHAGRAAAGKQAKLCVCQARW